MGAALRRERVQGKDKGTWREANRRRQLQTATQSGVMPTPQGKTLMPRVSVRYGALSGRPPHESLLWKTTEVPLASGGHTGGRLESAADHVALSNTRPVQVMMPWDWAVCSAGPRSAQPSSIAVACREAD